MTNSNPLNKKWTIFIIAQVVDENTQVEKMTTDFEYKDFMQKIQKNSKKAKNLKFNILEFHQSTNTCIIKKSALRLQNNKTLKGMDFYKPKTITDFFKNAIADETNTKEERHHMVILWGHGSGFNFFHQHDKNNEQKNGRNFSGTKTGNYIINEDDDISYKSQQRKVNLRNVLINQHIANLSFGKGLFQRTSSENIKLSNKLTKRLDKLYTAEQLAKILNATGKKVDVLIANSCWMNTIETTVALKDKVKIYAAPQTIVPFAGIDYDRLFTALDKNPGMTKRELAENLTNNYIAKYTDDSSFAKKFKRNRSYIDAGELSLSVIHLDKIEKEYPFDEILNCINDLGNHLSKQLQNAVIKDYYQERIDIARSFCGDFTHQGNYIDFTNFFCELIKSFQGSDPGLLKDIYKRFFLAKNKTLLSIVNPGKLFNFMPDFFYSQSPQMFSIYFPPRTGRSELQNKFISKGYFGKNKFSEKCTGWIQFLSTYLNILPE